MAKPKYEHFYFGNPVAVWRLKKMYVFKGAIPDSTLSSQRVVPHPSSPGPICKNATIPVENQQFELKLGEFRSVSVQITIQTL